MATDYVGHFYQSFRDGHRDRVQVGSDYVQAQAQGFDWNRSSTTEWIYYRGKFAASRVCDLAFGRCENSLVVFRFPGNELFNQGKEFLPLYLGGLRREVFARVVDEGCKSHRPTCSKRSPRPPGVKI